MCLQNYLLIVTVHYQPQAECCLSQGTLNSIYLEVVHFSKLFQKGDEKKTEAPKVYIIVIIKLIIRTFPS